MKMGYAGLADRGIAVARGVAMNKQAAAFNAKYGPAMARKGKITAKHIAGASIALGGVMALRNRSGRAADRVVGRPTGMYGY